MWTDAVTAVRSVLVTLAFALVTQTALANTPDCEAVAEQTAARHGLPSGLMPAISRVETGLKQGEKGVRAWPWTLNVQGKGYYFKTREDALAKLREVIASGVRNVDVGCMQINYRWHSSNFASIEEMMEPRSNTAYAARFLTELKDRHGSWEEATRHYHSADDTRGEAYLGRVSRVLAKLPQDQPSFVASTAQQMPQMASAGSAPAKRHRGDGVLALADQPLVQVPGQGGVIGAVVLPASPLPDLTAAMPTHQRLKRQRYGRRLSNGRQSMVSQWREEFANRL